MSFTIGMNTDERASYTIIKYFFKTLYIIFQFIKIIYIKKLNPNNTTQTHRFTVKTDSHSLKYLTFFFFGFLFRDMKEFENTIYKCISNKFHFFLGPNKFNFPTQ